MNKELLDIEKMAREKVYEFTDRFGYTPLEHYPIGDEYFGTWSIGDEFWDFQNIIHALKSGITADELSSWYWQTSDRYAEEKPVVNLSSWIMGARYE